MGAPSHYASDPALDQPPKLSICGTQVRRLRLIMGDAVNISIATAVITIAIGVVTAYLNWRAVPVRRQLTVQMTATSLLGPKTIGDQIQIQYGGEVLKNARLVEIILRNSGRAAIGSDLYDGGRPFVVRLGSARVVELLRTSNHAQGQTAPPATTTDHELRIGPGAIHRKQSLSYALLIEGGEDLAYQSPLTDVRIERVVEVPASRSRGCAYFLLGLSIVCLAVGGYVLYSKLANPVSREHPTPTVTTTVIVTSTPTATR